MRPVRRHVSTHRSVRLKSVIPMGGRPLAPIERVLRAGGSYLAIPPDPSQYPGLVEAYIGRCFDRDGQPSHLHVISETIPQIVETSRMGFRQILFVSGDNIIQSAVECVEVANICLVRDIHLDLIIVNSWEKLLRELEIDPKSIIEAMPVGDKL